MDATEQVLEVVLIGAGMAGLMTAKELSSAGRQVCVLERGRGVGGRLASRRAGIALAALVLGEDGPSSACLVHLAANLIIVSRSLPCPFEIAIRL